MLQQNLFSSFQTGSCPIAINSLDARCAIIRYPREQAIDNAWLSILGINKNRQLIGVSHEFALP
jgi:hypothetical protein